MTENFTEFYQNKKPVISLEIFPPKTPSGVENLFNEMKAMRRLNPKFVSVTYGAMGSTRDLTKDLAIRLTRELDFRTAFHFTCVGSGRDDIKRYVRDLSDKGIQLVVALRGDKPAGMKDFTPPPDGFRYANELVDYLKEVQPNLSLAVAGYPEKHVEAPNFEEDLKNLKRKVAAGADIIITQLFFDNADYYRYVEKVRALGIAIPVVPGILPVQNLKQIERIHAMSGAKLPEVLLQNLKACGDDENAMRDAGVEFAIRQCRDLLQNGAPGLHLYTLNKSYSVLKIADACADLLEK